MEKGHFVIGTDTNKPKHNYFDEFVFDSIDRNIVAYNGIDCDAIFHLAASADVTDSTRRPSLYYKNNLGATSSLFDNLIEMGWKNKPVIFSSTAAVYGKSNQPLKEYSSLSPPNSYGKSKLMCEDYFKDLWEIHNLPSVIFRFFNVCGAYEDVGDHLDSHHVVQKLCYSAVNNKDFLIYGHNYSTRDGTCIRDYLHILDVCEAFFVALDFLIKNPLLYTFNLGTSNGTSVKELATRFIANTGKPMNTILVDPRPGDPAYLVADPTLFIETTKFEYKHSSIDNIIDSAWKWYRRNNGI